MRFIELKPRCAKVVNGISIDPNPDWSFDAIVSELNSLESKLSVPSLARIPHGKTSSREHSQTRKIEKGSKGFVIRVPDDELDETNDDDEAMFPKNFVPARCFTPDTTSPSGSKVSEDGLPIQPISDLMDKLDPVSVGLLELSYEHQRKLKEEIKISMSALATNFANENERFICSLTKVKRSIESKGEMDKRVITRYRRKVVETLDAHLISIEKDREEWSLIEERKIRDDVSSEKAKRRELALLEEKVQRDKAETEEARVRAENKRIEEEKNATAEAGKGDGKQNDQSAALETSEVILAMSEHCVPTQTTISGISIHASESALKLEEITIRRHTEVSELKGTLKLLSTKDFQSFERLIARQIKQICGSEEAVREKASELVKIFKSSVYPQPVGFSVFAEKVVSLCVNTGTSTFALGSVVILVTSVFPLAMDLLLAEFYMASIYTVPKHFGYSQLIKKDAYKRMLRFQEVEGNMESTKQYLHRLESYMKLYGAMIQAEIPGVENIHGSKEGWAWLARLVNSLPANIFTAVALEGFLRTAGFALFRRYGYQFKKILNVIWKHFLHDLRSHKDSELEPIIRRISSYIETNRFLEEPEGSKLPGSTLSSTCVPRPEYSDPRARSYPGSFY